jgi:TolA-binding protein
VCAFELNAFADAHNAFSRVIELTETETAAKAQLALGETLARQKKYAEAGREFLKAHILYGYPQWKTKGLLRAAQCFSQAGEKERAAKYLKLIVDQFPKSKEAPEAGKLLAN